VCVAVLITVCQKITFDVLWIQEILQKVYVVNLDTGESVPLGSAEEKIPKCVNPLSLHIMRRTKEYQRFLAFSGLLALIMMRVILITWTLES